MRSQLGRHPPSRVQKERQSFADVSRRQSQLLLSVLRAEERRRLAQARRAHGRPARYRRAGGCETRRRPSPVDAGLQQPDRQPGQLHRAAQPQLLPLRKPRQYLHAAHLGPQPQLRRVPVFRQLETPRQRGIADAEPLRMVQEERSAPTAHHPTARRAAVPQALPGQAAYHGTRIFRRRRIPGARPCAAWAYRRRSGARS